MPGVLEMPRRDRLRGYLLGTLPGPEFDEVDRWAQSDPDAEAVLGSIVAADSVTESLALSCSMSASTCDLDAVIRAVREGLEGGSPVGGDETSPFAVGAEVGDYRLLREIGRGGMGVVYEAEDRKLGRTVAVKVLRDHVLDNPEYRERFRREGRMAAALRSDHVVTIHHVGEVDDRPYLVMEHLAGANLEDWLNDREGPPGLPEIARIVRELLAGLASAHKAGLIHRDIKPTNLWIESPSGRLKILDFGMTRPSAGPSALTETGRVMCTPDYASPEQVAGRPLDARTDLFSAGAVIYRIFLGKSPFKRDDRLATLGALANFHPRRLPTIPPALWPFLRGLLSKDPAGRPRDAIKALEEWEAIEPKVLAMRPPPQGPVRKFALDGLVFGLVACSLLLLVIIRYREGKLSGTLILDTDAPAARGEATPAARGEATPGGPVAAVPSLGARVTVKEMTPGFVDDTSGNKTGKNHDVGATGTLLRKSPIGNRWYVRWDTGGDPSWISADFADLK